MRFVIGVVAVALLLGCQSSYRVAIERFYPRAPFYFVGLVGDCDYDGRVQAEEWSLCWMIEAGQTGAAGLKPCVPCDTDGDGIVTSEEAKWASWNGGVRN